MGIVNLLLVVGGPVLVVGLVVMWVVVRHRHNEPIRTWLAEYRRAERRGMLHVLRAAPSGPWNNWPAVIEAGKKARAAKEKSETDEQARKERDEQMQAKLAADFAAIRKRIEGLRVSPVTRAEYDELVSIKWQLKGDDLDWAKAQIKRFAEERVNRLLAAARANDRQAFLELQSFVHRGDYSEYSRAIGVRYVFPEDWDDMMVRYIENPSVGDFRVTHMEIADGECRLMAAEALRVENLFLGKVVLAFCSESHWDYHAQSHTYHWRDEIGHVLLAEVTKMVERLHHELGLTFAATTN